MSQIQPIFKREFLGYFRTPVAYVFLIVFLMASVGCAFFIGGFLQRNTPAWKAISPSCPGCSFAFIPAVGMRLWFRGKEGGDDRTAVHPARDTAGGRPREIPGRWAFSWVSPSC